MIDSREQELTPQEIVEISVKETKSQYSAEQVFAVLMSEMSEAGSFTIRNGNTLFIVNPVEEQEGSAFFRALNADTVENYLENSKLFIKAIQMAGFNLLVTQYEDPAISNLLKMVKKTGQDYYDPSTQLEIKTSDDGKTYQAVIWTDKAQVD